MNEATQAFLDDLADICHKHQVGIFIEALTGKPIVAPLTRDDHDITYQVDNQSHLIHVA